MQKSSQKSFVAAAGVIGILGAGYVGVTQWSSKSIPTVSTNAPIVTQSNSVPNLKGNLVLNLLSRESQVFWRGEKQIGNAHEGSVSVLSGNLSMIDNDLVGGEVILDMKALTVSNVPPVGAEQLLEHLKSADFFEVDTYPQAKIVVTRSQLVNPGTYDVEANLTIKDITKPIKFKAVFESKSNRIMVRSKLIIDRTQWNIKYGSSKFFGDLGDQLIKDEISFDVVLAFTNSMSEVTKIPVVYKNLSSRIEGGIPINIETVSVSALEYRSLASRIE